MLYFAYGSNMSSKRIKFRVPSAEFVSVCVLERYKLLFHKKSRDESSKCDAKFTGNSGDHVIGVLFDIKDSEKSELDHAEGLNSGYKANTVTVVDINGKRINALIYIATKIDSSLKPYCWYKEHVLRGALEHRLPDSYVQEIRNVDCIEDTDENRRNVELQIYL